MSRLISPNDLITCVDRFHSILLMECTSWAPSLDPSFVSFAFMDKDAPNALAVIIPLRCSRGSTSSFATGKILYTYLPDKIDFWPCTRELGLFDLQEEDAPFIYPGMFLYEESTLRLMSSIYGIYQEKINSQVRKAIAQGLNDFSPSRAKERAKSA
jgi:hypothetical protein